MLKSLSVVALAIGAIASDDSHDHDHDHDHDEEPSLVLLDTFTDLADDAGNATATESCTWDSVNSVFTFVDRNGAVGTITKEGVFTLDTNTGDDIGEGMLGTVFVPGSPNRLYIADAAMAKIRIYDVDAKAFESDAIDLPNGLSGTNGLCYDADNDAMYVGNVGADFSVFPPALNQHNSIYKIDAFSTASRTFSMLNITTLFDQNGDLVTETVAFYQQNGANRQFYPNGCAVVGGLVVFTEIRAIAPSAALGIYNISSGEFSINTEALTVSGDDIGVYGNVLVLSTWGVTFGQNDGQILFANLEEDELMFEVGLADVNISGPADMGAPSDDGIFCIPGFQGTGEVYFVQVEGVDIDDDTDGVDGLNAIVALIVAVFVSLY